MATVDIDLGAYQLGWRDEIEYAFTPRKGLDETVIREMSAMKKEPEWMLEFRLKAYQRFLRKPMPQWGGGGALNTIDFDDIYYYVKPAGEQQKDWDMVPESIKSTYEKLGIPQAERKYLAGVTAQYECLRGDVRVYTANRGLVAIRDIEPGDTVFSLDETSNELIETTVRASAQTDTRQTYRVSIAGASERSIYATDNHPLLVLTETGAQWLPIGDISVGAEVAIVVGSKAMTLAGGPGGTVEVPTEVGFARVTEIVPEDVAPVYDIEVDGSHNFVAEGIIVHNSEVVYHRNREDLEKLGVLFTDMDTALREYPEIVKEYFGTIIPPNDNKFAALNSAVWSGGSFIYVPPGVHVDQPLQAYFRINSENMGQFERTLIIVDEGAYVHYVEGCSAPVYTTDSLHSAVVEIVVKEGGRCRYTTIQNWSNNVFNLVTKRAAAYRNATMEWVDGNLGCLAEGSTVTTRSGPKAIELVQPGDEVMSWDEDAGAFVWSEVTAKRYSGEQPVREVRTGERRIQVTDNHPFFSYTYDPTRAKKLGRYALDYVRADQLSEAIVPRTSLDYGEPHKLALPETEVRFEGRNQYQGSFESVRNRKSRLNTGETTTDDLMWLFGLFVGDGSIDNQRSANGGHRWSKVVLSVPRQDRARSRLVEVMGRLMPDTEPSERKDGVTLTWSSVELAELLEGNGFVSGAQKKRLPEWVYDLPESQRISFVAGFLDSDGCAPRGRRGFSIKSVNRPLLEDVARLLTTLGIPARIHTEHDDDRAVSILGIASVSHGSHRIDFSVDERLLDHVSEDLRQAALAQTTPSLKWHRRVGRSDIQLPEEVEIRKVEVTEHLETVPTWDIEVAETGNFVAEGFIVHNSRLTMKYPAVWLMEPGAHGEVLSIAFAGEGQHQDAGAKIIHVAPDTTSTIVSKSISKGGGRAGYRGLVRVEPGAENAKSFVRCDALILDEESRSDTYPYMEIEENDAEIGHEATVSKVGEEQLFYLMSRGLTEDQATSMIVAGFIEPIVKELPMEYAVEMNRLIELNMAEAGAVG